MDERRNPTIEVVKWRQQPAACSVATIFCSRTAICRSCGDRSIDRMIHCYSTAGCRPPRSRVVASSVSLTKPCDGDVHVHVRDRRTRPSLSLHLLTRPAEASVTPSSLLWSRQFVLLISLFACWFQSVQISQPTVFSSKKNSISQPKPVPAPTSEQAP